MVIEINGSRKVEVSEPYLVVDENSKRLYNKKSKETEGIDGDIVSFIIEGGEHPMRMKGPVDGYTCGKTVKIRGVDKLFENVKEKIIDHVSVITDTANSETIIMEDNFQFEEMGTDA